MLTWEKNISMISKTAGKYPQESYAAVVCVIQSEWIFLQRITWDTGELFAGVKKTIQETFLPRIFFRKTKILSPVIGVLSTISVKKDGLGLLNTVTSDQENYLSPMQGSAKLVHAVTGGGESSNADHLRTLSEERSDGKKAWDVAYESILTGLLSNIQGTNKRLLLISKITGAWLSVRGTTVSGTVLSAT